MLASFLLGTNEMPYQGKQVGYAYEINWIWNQIIVIPLALFFSFLAISKMKDTFIDLTNRQMLIDKNKKPLTCDYVLEKWRPFLNVAIKWSIVLGIIAFLASYVQAYMVSPYLSHTSVQDLTTPPEILNVFWTWKAFIYPTQISALSNALFTFIAFTVQAIHVTFFLLFISILGAYG